MTGLRKAMKLGTLKKYNKKYGLGMTDDEIDGMSVIQLRKKLYSISVAFGLPIRNDKR